MSALLCVELSVADAVSALSGLVGAGDISAARKLGKKLVNKADDRSLWLIAKIVTLVEQEPSTAVDSLRHWWRTAPTESDKAIIAACAPRRPQPARSASRRNGRTNNRPASVVTKAQREELRRRRNTRQEIQSAASFARYQAERAGVDDEPRQDDDTVYASGFDFDTTAVDDLAGLPCAICLIERAVHDRVLRHDDGLCVECRDGHTGITPVHSDGKIQRAQFIMDRCAVIAANHTARAAIALMRQWWTKSTANRHDRPIIAGWIAAHPELIQQAAAEQYTAVRVAARRAAWLAAEQDAAERAAEHATQQADAAEYAAQYTADLATEAAAAEQRAAARVAAKRAVWLSAEQDAAAIDQAAADRVAAENAAAEQYATVRVAVRRAAWLAAEQAAAIEQAATQPLADCECCYNGRRPHDIRNQATDDGLCRDCRALDGYHCQRTVSIDQPATKAKDTAGPKSAIKPKARRKTKAKTAA